MSRSLKLVLEQLTVLISKTWENFAASNLSGLNPEKKFLSLRSYTAKVAIWGTGEPILLLPGIAGGYELLAPFISYLAKGFQVISFQYRGEDSFFSFRSKTTLDDLAQDLDELISGLGLEKPPLVGFSFGGTLALHYSNRFPSKTGPLILQGTGSRFERGILHRLAGLILAHYQLPHENPLVNQFFRLFLGGSKASALAVDKIAAQCWRTDQAVIANRLKLIRRFHYQDPFKKLNSPCMLMHGENDILVSQNNFSELARELPGAEVHHLRGLGHLAFLQAPEIMADLVSQFLNSNQSRQELLAS
ncbi:MAG: alpha/beta hydrolase [Gemmataceae bacterium]|nr:alpha/beta hydrolase [Gemmataceae bacterium]